MNFDLVHIRELAKSKEDENWRFRDGRAVPVVITVQVNLQRDEAGKLVVTSTGSPTASPK